MDLNGNSDYKLHGRAGRVECFQWIVRDSGDVENKDVTEGMSLDSELPSLFHCAHMCIYVLMYTQISGQVHV